jgi:predicted nucleotidyltransferase
MPQDDPILKRFTASLNAFRIHIRKIVLFGSRARGDERPWSDYDLLILVDRRDQSLVDKIYDAVHIGGLNVGSAGEERLRGFCLMNA